MVVSQEPAPDGIENEFSEPHRGATGSIFQQQSTAPNGADEHDAAGSAATRDPNASVNDILDTVAGAVSATDTQGFLLGLIGALGRTARSPVGGESSVGIILRELGNALDEELDEEPAFHDLVDALERRRFRAPALNEAVPIVAAFLARIVSAPILRTVSDTAPTGIADLVHAAAQVARKSLERGGARSWRALPEAASTIAQRAEQRKLSITSLAEVLPRLLARLGSGSADETTGASEHMRVRMTAEPRRMVLSGPVEIVILER
jgi:hypothetical protein